MNTDRSITRMHPLRVCVQRYIKTPTVPSHLPRHTSIYGNSKYEAKREPPFCFGDPLQVDPQSAGPVQDQHISIHCTRVRLFPPNYRTEIQNVSTAQGSLNRKSAAVIWRGFVSTFPKSCRLVEAWRTIPAQGSLPGSGQSGHPLPSHLTSPATEGNAEWQPFDKQHLPSYMIWKHGNLQAKEVLASLFLGIV